MYQEDMHYVNKKEYKLKDLMPTSLWLMDKIFDKRIKPHRKVSENILLIYGKREYNYRLRMYEAEKFALGIMMLMGVLFLTLLVSLQSGEGSPLHQNRLNKPAIGEGNKAYELQAEIELDGEKEIRDFTVLVPEETPHKELAVKMLKEAAKHLKDLVVIRSGTAKVVHRQLYLPDRYEDTNIKIKWIIDTPMYIEGNGELNYENITKSGQEAAVTAVLTYAGEEYKQTVTMTVYPKTLTKEEKLQLVEEALKEQLEFEQLLEQSDKNVNLPTSIDGHSAKVEWLFETKSNSGLKLFMLGILVIIFITVLKDYELKKKVDHRNFQIRRSFPEFVIKLTLLINAGMTLSRAWTSIGKDYVNQLNKGESPLFLYEEMLVTLQDIQNGVSEAKAYEDFGKRCKIPEMMRFTSVIIQNLKKGNDTLVMALQGQANEAWEVRKNVAKKEGEKASSKLLLPMGIMFMIIIIIVMLPAFMSFTM